MRYDLTSPCRDCPFRTEGGRRAHSTRHAEAILAYEGPFPCHKTVEYVGRAHWRDRGRGQACAGSLAHHERAGTGERQRRLALAAGRDPSTITGARVLETADAFLAARCGAPSRS